MFLFKTCSIVLELTLTHRRRPRQSRDRALSLWPERHPYPSEHEANEDVVLEYEQTYTGLALVVASVAIYEALHKGRASNIHPLCGL